MQRRDHEPASEETAPAGVRSNPRLWRSRWAAIGAAIAVTLGAGGLATVGAAVESGEKAVFVPITPCRLLDTRPTENVGPRTAPLGPNEEYKVKVHGTNGRCTIPTDAVGVATNVTITNPTADSFLTVFPADAPLPDSSNLNWIAGQAPTPNQVTTDLSGTGEITLFNRHGQVHTIVDIVGYFADHRHDDRYYTKNQTNSQIAAAGTQIIATSGRNLTIVDYEPDRVFFSESFTTTKAGYLEITKSFIGAVSCASARGYYLVLDGVGIQNSLVYDSLQEIQRRDLYGVTTTVIPAGNHTISIGGECTNGDSSGSNTTAVYSTRIVVHPG